MSGRYYFLVNDTRYDNHHGCLTVVGNLHAAMESRGWRCCGSLPVSSQAGLLKAHHRELGAAELVIVNGEGTLHHDSRNATRLFEICSALQDSHPITLVNAVWQNNDIARWRPLLEKFQAVYARDQRSQKQLQEIVPIAGYAPDLTFYRYPRFNIAHEGKYLCTDSVINTWTEQLLRLSAVDDEIDLCTMFTGRLEHLRGSKDWGRLVKYKLCPRLWDRLHLNVPPRYKVLSYACPDTAEFLRRLASYRAVCVARYHALGFAVQQQVPFLAVASNSHNSEALLEELGLPLDRFLIKPTNLAELKERLKAVVRDYPDYRRQIEEFNQRARDLIDAMFDRVTAA